MHLINNLQRIIRLLVLALEEKMSVVYHASAYTRFLNCINMHNSITV